MKTLELVENFHNFFITHSYLSMQSMTSYVWYFGIIALPCLPEM